MYPPCNAMTQIKCFIWMMGNLYTPIIGSQDHTHLDLPTTYLVYWHETSSHYGDHLYQIFSQLIVKLSDEQALMKTPIHG